MPPPDLEIEEVPSTPDVLEITAFVPGFSTERLFQHWTEERLVFTWKWDHEDRPTREVIILFDPAEGGAQLSLSHGPYTSLEEDQEERRGHFEGWRHFLARLQRLTEDGP